jgi:hypothetical protein
MLTGSESAGRGRGFDQRRVAQRQRVDVTLKLRRLYAEERLQVLRRGRRQGVNG